MNEKTSFKTRIRSGPPPIGTLITIDSPEVAEALSLSGLDWLFIDMEHGPIDIAATQNMVRAIGGNCLSLVRLPENSPLWVRRVLDTGCDGIIVPLVLSAIEARQAVSAAKYPPAGRRSVGVARAHSYGLQFAEYVARANEQTTTIVQIEHITAVEALDEILAVEGIDGILIGPYDLSGSMNRLGDVSHPEVRAAIATIRRSCAERAMPVGIFVLNPEGISAELARGSSFLAVGTELTYMSATVRQVLDLARG